jgi:uncharacterized RDD family membrane protein YckC
MKPARVQTPEVFASTAVGSGCGPVATPHPAVSDRWSGARLDHFLVERPLGRGGMGAVYLAHDESLDRPVAIKVLPDALAENPALQERFLREARAQARLNSPHVVHIHYIGHLPGPDGTKGSLYFAMELVDGETLEAMLERDERLEAEEARQLMMQVARGLRDAERAGIIHRDIKPSNLLRDTNGYVKIADFGLAKPADRKSDSSPAITAAGIVLGTPLYMAPEQARSEEVDHRADMYALGCSFHHLIAGEPPFDAPTPIAVVAKHLTEPPPPLREVAPAITPALAKIIARLMEKDREDRFASYDELLAALEAAEPERTSYAGFWVRAASVTLECMLAIVLVALLDWPGLVLHLAYITVGHAYFGQTLAKYLLRIEVRKVGGGHLGFVRSLLRTVTSMWLPFLVGMLTFAKSGIAQLRVFFDRMKPSEMAQLKTLLIAVAIANALLTILWVAGLAMAAFHPRKRALHDLIVDSEVVYKLPTQP